jgi:hypothetical protein
MINIKNTISLINKNKWFILAIVIIAAAFYWYEWRPARIEKECNEAVLKTIWDNKANNYSEEGYKACVRSGGIKNYRDARDATE